MPGRILSVRAPGADGRHVIVMVATAAVGAAVFLCLWWTRANSYEPDGDDRKVCKDGRNGF